MEVKLINLMQIGSTIRSLSRYVIIFSRFCIIIQYDPKFLYCSIQFQRNMEIQVKYMYESKLNFFKPALAK